MRDARASSSPHTPLMPEIPMGRASGDQAAQLEAGLLLAGLAADFDARKLAALEPIARLPELRQRRDGSGDSMSDAERQSAIG